MSDKEFAILTKILEKLDTLARDTKKVKARMSRLESEVVNFRAETSASFEIYVERLDAIEARLEKMEETCV